MSKKLTDIKVYRVDYFGGREGDVAFRIVFSFGEVRREENSVIITDGQEASVEFRQDISIQETIGYLLSLVKLLKDSKI